MAAKTKQVLFFFMLLLYLEHIFNMRHAESWWKELAKKIEKCSTKVLNNWVISLKTSQMSSKECGKNQTQKNILTSVHSLWVFRETMKSSLMEWDTKVSMITNLNSSEEKLEHKIVLFQHAIVL